MAKVGRPKRRIPKHLQRKTMIVRLPADAHAFLVAQAEKNYSSQNGEVIKAVRMRMEAETATAA